MCAARKDISEGFKKAVEKAEIIPLLYTREKKKEVVSSLLRDLKEALKSSPLNEAEPI